MCKYLKTTVFFLYFTRRITYLECKNGLSNITLNTKNQYFLISYIRLKYTML